MESRFEEIDNFLKHIASQIKNVSDTEKNKIYEELCLYGLSENDMNDRDLKRIQTRIELGKPMHRIIRKTNWHSSGPFLMIDDKRMDTAPDRYRIVSTKKIPPHVKLYIPANKENVQELAESLITFLAKNDIVHCSKVANKVRADDIVVRVFSLDDCKQVVEYINKNYADKVMQTNPFLLKDGCVGISADGGFSFNERVANFISEYMTLLSEQDKLKTASREDFKKFIDKRRKEIFIDGTGIEKFIEDKDIRYKGVPNIDYLTENKYIMDLLSISLDKEKGFEDFESYWEEIINPKNREKLKKSIEELVESQKDNISDEKIKEEEKMEENQETEKINDMRFKENEEHDEMAKYETEEWFYDEDTNDEYNKDGYNRDGFNKEGLHRETGTKFAPNGYDKFGFDREGHDIYGDTREEAAKSSDILDAEIKRQYRIKENGFDPDEELEDDNYSEEEQQDGVEINEFGEIIRPNKEETTRQLENMTIEELQKAVQENDRSIKENDKSIKQALIKKLLEQQRTIEKQQLEMDTLNSQKQEL